MTLRLLTMAALLAASFAASADTVYVRPDGDNSCTGRTDAAFSTGVSDCAKATPAQGIATMSGGDTLIIRSGSYSITSTLTPPSGTSTAPTRILGENHAACRSKPELWGTDGLNNVISLSSRSWVEVACLEITDHSRCMYQHHDAAVACTSTQGARNGVYAYNASEITLRDLNIHGMAANGYKGGKVHNFTLERVRLVGNGDAGFHGASTTTADDSFTGTIRFKNVEIAWNGCGEDYPTPKIHGCYGERRGGYGDGLGTKDTSGTWIFEDSYVHHNTSDGLDLRYTKLAGADVQIRRSWFYNNAGNQVKSWGKTLIENSFISSYCTYFGSRYGSTTEGEDPQSCRADGTPIFIVAPNIDGVGITIRYSTITGNSAVLVQTSDLAGATSKSIARLENNVFVGQQAFNGTGLSYFVNAGPVGVQYYNNHVYNVRNSVCPTGSACTNPLLRNQAITAFDPRPQSGSPVLGAANTTYTTPATDITGRTRPAAPARGAFEYAP